MRWCFMWASNAGRVRLPRRKSSNVLLVEYATQGKLVVRLKGGDVSFFSNILDELQTLTAHGIAYEIIPGVTAASGAAAYAGIPLTARSHSVAVRFLTLYKNDMLDEACWKDLAETGDTLVFYMSSDTTDEVVSRLLENKVGADKWIAVVEQATTPYQQVYNCNIYDYAKTRGGARYISPTLLIIGKVAALSGQFQWIPQTHLKKQYFKSVEKTKSQGSALA